MNNSSVCVDASLVVRVVTAGIWAAPLRDIWAKWRERGQTVAAPMLLYYEVTNALYRYVAHGDLRLKRHLKLWKLPLG